MRYAVFGGYFGGSDRQIAQQAIALLPSWQPVAPVLLLVGEADDWTPAPPCVTLASQSGGRLELRTYPGAHHDFDAPDTPQRVLRGVGATSSGTATIGTHPAAREDALRRVPDYLARVMR